MRCDYLSQGDAPSLRSYSELDEPGVLDVYPPEIWPCNYFNRLDNAPGLGHVHFAHRDSREASGTKTGIGTVYAEETEYGVRTNMELAQGRATIVHFHMPNINQFVSVGDLKLRDVNNPSAKGTMARFLCR